VIVGAVVDDALSPDFPLGVELEAFVRPEDAERFVQEVRGDDPEFAKPPANRGVGAEDAERFVEEVHRDDPEPASYLRIEERELEAGGLN
jgi:(2Fe-2S) ferredoxin